MAICRKPSSFWNLWETTSLGHILARGLLPFPPATKSAWHHWETAVLGQILARSLVEPDCATLEVFWAVLGLFWAVLSRFLLFGAVLVCFGLFAL